MKSHRIRIKKKLILFSTLKCGTYGLQSTKSQNYNLLQINLLIKLLKKYLKPFIRKRNFIIKKLPTFLVTRKPKEIRMGRGKGVISHKIAIFKKGQILLEVFKLNDVLNFYILKMLKNKINYLKILEKSK